MTDSVRPNCCTTPDLTSPFSPFFLATEAKAEETKRYYAAPLNRDPPLRSASPRRLGFLPPLISPSPPWTPRTRASPPPPARPRPPGSTGWGPPSSGSATTVASSSAPIPGPALVTPFGSYRSVYAAGDPAAGRGRFGAGMALRA